MKRLLVPVAAALACAACLAPAAGAAESECEPAVPAFGLCEFDVTFTEAPPPGAKFGELGPALTEAGSHPFALTVSLKANVEGGEAFAVGAAKDIETTQIPGFAGIPAAVPRCAASDFLISSPSSLNAETNATECAEGSVVGTVEATIGEGKLGLKFPQLAPVYDLRPPPGVVAKLGFTINYVPVTIDITASESPPYNVEAHVSGISQILEFFGSKLTLWGNPSDHTHDPYRGNCLTRFLETPADPSLGECAASIPPVAFLTMPRACEGPLATTYATDSWQDPGARLPDGEPDLSDPNWLTGQSLTHDDLGNPRGMSACGSLSFGPSITARPTTRAAQSATGLDFSLDVQDEGIASPSVTASSDIKEAEVILPRGMSINPSQAEGLEVCSEAQLARESARSGPGEGCPEAAKIGTIEVETPLLPDELLKGSLFVAKPYENEFNSLIAFYIVIKDPELGIFVKQAAKVTPDPASGQLVTTTRDMPQLPFSHFRLHFREGGRSPLISPPGCGAFDVTAKLTPWSGGAPATSVSTFQIVSGPGESPCPQGATPFGPGFEAGSVNAAAKAFSPFYMRLTRRDGEQDMTKFSAILPPGVAGILAGLSRCPEAAIAAARARTGPNGGQEERDQPSCPASSKIGRTMAGAGVGSQLTYVPGSLYLAGPIGGDPLSVVSITPAVAGPFDAGVVVVRVALTLNPVSGEIEADGSASDPIPHILQGIPLNVRDLRVYADRAHFTFNPTSCDPSRVRATLWGGGTALLPGPEVPVALSTRYQAVDCASLGFRPKLAIKLRGGTRRGAHPALRAVVTPRPQDANFAAAVVTLPRSAFLDQAHIRTICTRVQFAAGGGNGEHCPAGAIYGHAKAWTPILDEPAQGPVFLRSSTHNLPDLVIALQGPPSAAAKAEISARIDSLRGGIRASFEGIPDLPVSRFLLEMQGGRKGLIINSTNLCRGTHRANARLKGQNGRLDHTHPPVGASGCGKQGKHRRR